ncbi:HET-domain-containing protein [Annulohypoxylon moriforme]|nr:HET-domain-containing protein [Annulohypoxylon moriforme]
MFAWYRDSQVCYAYLADVQTTTGTFAQSRWFTRGWTLQELLAPSRVIFFDHRWTILGDRSELAIIISSITRIHIGALNERSTIHDYSIAQRMSWAADRQTSRLEDIAYCLLGIFDINIPLLYGEGLKAFSRLQQEIIKVSDDQSILAWDLPPSNAHPSISALAHSPTWFRFCGSIVTSDESQWSAHSITNLGISMKLDLIKPLTSGIFLAGLNCTRELYREHANQRGLDEVLMLPRNFRVWIPLLYLSHGTYTRAHHLPSKIFLGKSYSMLRRPVPTDLFLSTDTSQVRTSQVTQPFESPVQILQQRRSSLPSGVVVMVASGSMTPRGHILGKSSHLDNLYITQLRCRATSAVSHQLISNGTLTILFSVFWDNNESPLDWLHTTIVDPKLTISNQMIINSEWSYHFDDAYQIQSSQHYNSMTSMRELHTKLQKTYGESLKTFVMEGRDPIVVVEEPPLQDSFRKWELIVNVTFREA